MKRKVIPFCLLVILAFASTAFGMSYFGYTTYGGTWHDANKTWVQDSEMCWAAAASNILDWAGYATPQFSNETLIFNDFKNHWTNQGGFTDYGWAWYLNGTPPKQDSSSQLTGVAGGDNNWPTVPFASVYHYNWNESQVIPAMGQFLHMGYGTTLAVYTTSGGHALTAWGYEYDIIQSKLVFEGVYVTDSDDNYLGLKYYPVSFDDNFGVWNMGGTYSGWHIGEVNALDNNPTPEPLTVLLLGIGLFGIVVFKKKTKK